MSFELLQADCIEAMAAMPESSVDAIVTDPPYGLEFMGKEWDRFRVDDPGTNRNRGARAGAQGGTVTGDGSHPARGNVAVAIGGGKRPTTSRCTGCGKRDQFRNDHECDPHARWVVEILDPYAAPPTMLAFHEWCRVWAREALRVLKPGAHILAFGGTRTYHRLTCALEDAGFEIRDCLAWMYGSGFPKSLDISKAIDKAAGHWRGKAGEPLADDALRAFGQHYERTEKGDPVTAAAAAWNGWGTALKPAFEPIVLARKPLSEKNVAANVLRWGTGGLNVDGCRIEAEKPTGWSGGGSRLYEGGLSREGGEARTTDAGRWPANVALDEEAAAMLDEQSGEQVSGTAYEPDGGERPGTVTNVPGEYLGRTLGYGDTGGASRFFYVAKADSSERNAGLEGLAPRVVNEACPPGASGSSSPRAGAGRNGARRNHHPTVKPVALMAWLVRLVTPPGGTVLDPFMGSGSTGIAATRQGFRFIGIEREADYLAIARRRIEEDAPLFNRETELTPEPKPQSVQLEIP